MAERAMASITCDLAAGDRLHLWLRPIGNAASAEVRVRLSGGSAGQGRLVDPHMIGRSPSPLAGEGGSRRRRETDEGAGAESAFGAAPSSGPSGHLLLQGEKGDALSNHTSHKLIVDGPTRQPLPVEWESPAAGQARLEWDPDCTEVSVAYAFTPATVGEHGISVLWAAPETAIEPARFRLHVHPPFGWMNDPNGLCEVEGLTHLFYQHNPHGRRWNTMHWGHVVSRDGITWRHQPIALEPREDILRGAAEQGGAFSGSALPQPDGSLRLFYTDRQDSRRPSREWQMTAVLADGLAAGPSRPVLDAHPPLPGFRDDWRDPFVFAGPDGRLKMLLGGADAGGSVVLLYETDDPDGAGGWRFVDVLLREPSRRAIPAECPCMIRLDEADLWVLIFGLIGSRDPATRRRNLTRTFIGRFDGQRFEPLYPHELDFGTDCYAAQVWHAADGPRLIAWAANWTDVFADRDFESAMTFPRRLVWQDGRLLTPPIDAVAGFRRGEAVPLPAEGRVALDDGLAEIVVAVAPGQPFTLGFDHPDHDIGFVFDGTRLELAFDPPGNRAVPRYDTICPELAELRVIVDVGLVEAFVDGGRACCTKRIDSAEPVESVWLDRRGDAHGRVWQLRPATGPAAA